VNETKTMNEKITIIEDDLLIAEMLEFKFRTQGFRMIKRYDSGESFLNEKLPNTDLFILDYHLGEGRNGVNILRKIRQRFPNSKVVMFTSQEDISVAVNSLKIGADAYIIKGEDMFDELENEIKRLIGKVGSSNYLIKKMHQRDFFIVGSTALLSVVFLVGLLKMIL